MSKQKYIRTYYINYEIGNFHRYVLFQMYRLEIYKHFSSFDFFSSFDTFDWFSLTLFDSWTKSLYIWMFFFDLFRFFF